MATATQRKTKTQRTNENTQDGEVIVERPDVRVVMPSRFSTVIWLIPIFVNLVMLQRAINHTKKRIMRKSTQLVDRVQTEAERLSSAAASIKR